MTTGNDVTRRRRFFALLFGAALCSCVCSAAAAATWGLEELMRRLAQVKSSKAKFVERKSLQILNAPLEFTGTLSYSAPAHVEKHTLTPKPESMVLDQDRLTVEDKTRGQKRTLTLQDYPVLWAFIESIRSTLAGDLQSLNRFYRVDLEGDEQEWRLVLKPRESRVQEMVSSIRIGGTAASIRTIEVNEANGDRSVMTITEIRP